MKWFKHMSNASDDEFMAKLEDLFGLEGYARWWKLLEAIAKQMDETDRCYAEYPLDKWKKILCIKQEKMLKLFLNFCQTSNKLHSDFSGTFIKLSCPKLLELRDEHTRKLRSKSGGSQEKVAQDLELDLDRERREGEKVDRTVEASRFTLATLPEDYKIFCLKERPDLNPETVFKKFIIHNQHKSSTDWLSAWQKWVIDEYHGKETGQPTEPAQPRVLLWIKHFKDGFPLEEFAMNELAKLYGENWRETV